jgi:hypothetical protein
MLFHMAMQHRTLDDIEAELRDPAYWEGSTTEAGIPCPNPILTIGVRLELDDARLIGDAARKANLPINRYVLQVAREAARRDLGDPSSAED